jgi:hypothetical protein
VIANAAFAAALVTFLMAAWMAGELTFLAPFKSALFHEHGGAVLGGVLLVFLNLCALFYGAARILFLRDAGRKLTHLDRELRRGGAPHEELAAYFQSREP